VFIGKRIAKTGHYKRYPLTGAVLLPIGIFLFSRMTPTTSHLYSSLFMLVVGLGMGLIMPITTVAVQNAVPQEDLGVATSSSVFFRSMGASFGVAILGAVMNARLRYWFPHFVPHSGGIDVTSVAYSPAAVYKLPAPIREGIIEAFGHSLHVVFLVAAPLSMLVFPLILRVKEIPLRDRAYIGKTGGGMEGGEHIEMEPVDEQTDHAVPTALASELSPGTAPGVAS
jgi:hypothetical protein